MATTPEHKVKLKLRKALKELQVELPVWFSPIADRYTTGLPDYLVVFAGRAVFIECKSPKGKLRPAQLFVKKLIEQAGARYVVYRGEPASLIRYEVTHA